jgi:hypothetical protein
MTARDELFSYICPHRGISELEANDLIDAFAHELADKIRTHSDPTGCMDCREETCDYFADLIEPESYK